MNKCRLIILIAITTRTFAGTNYYVSPTGLNTNSGLTTATAFKTITYAATVATHGDTINVMAGTYTNASYGTWDVWKSEQTVRINNKNSVSGDYLVIRPYNHDAVKLRGDGDFIVQIRNSSYIRIEEFEVEGEVDNIPLDTGLKYQFVYRQCMNSACTIFTDTFRVAFGTPPASVDTMTFPVLSNTTRPTTVNNIGLLVQNCHHVDVVKNKIHHNTGTGLRVFQSDYINVIENDVYENSRRSSVGNHGLVFHSSTSIDDNNGYKIFISRNHVHDNYNEIYSWSELKTFITPHIDEGKGISMQKNTAANGWVHGKIKIENNIADHNGFSGVHINEGIRIDMVNNTAYNNLRSYDGSGNNIGISLAGGDSIGFYNNISVAPSGIGAFAYTVVGTNVIATHNLVWGDYNTGYDAIDVNTIAGDPMFVDTIQFKLQSASPAVNTSLSSIAPTVDYYNLPRDTNPDRGAVEFFSASLPLTLLRFSAYQNQDRQVNLFWETANETHTDQFIVQKSYDATHWVDLATVLFSKGPLSVQQYSIRDSTPFKGSNFYKLKMLDKDGKSTFSNVIYLNYDYGNSFTVFPNPASGQVSVRCDKFTSFHLYSLDGRELTTQVQVEGSGQLHTLNLANLVIGIYVLEINGQTVNIVKSSR